MLVNGQLLKYFHGEHSPVCIIPCDNTDAWIVTAYDDMENIEFIDDPWNSIISRAKEYHGIRISDSRTQKTKHERERLNRENIIFCLLPVIMGHKEKVWESGDCEKRTGIITGYLTYNL